MATVAGDPNRLLSCTGPCMRGSGLLLYGGSKSKFPWMGANGEGEGQMVTEFLVYQLLNNYLNSTEVKAYVDKYDYYIFPVINPDGKLFSSIIMKYF
jgi:hypothetical protein